LKQVVIKFGLLAIAIAILLKLTQYSLFFSNIRQEITIGIMGVGFAIIGLYLGKQFRSKKPVQRVENLTTDQEKAEVYGITKRELEVLSQMSKGKSNNEIAESLFISENTVKTHVSNLLTKLNAKRRTEALKRAREYDIISHS